MIMITGGLGYVGLHTAAKLLEEDHQILIVDNLQASRLEMLERLEYLTGRPATFVRQDIRNTPALQRIAEQYGVTAVVHMATQSTASHGFLPLELYNTNIGGLLSVLRVMSRTGINTLLFGSSSCIYAPSDKPVAESSEIDPATPYARSYDYCEQILSDLAADDRWRIAVMRYFEIGGADESGLIGDIPRCAPTRLLPCLALGGSGGVDPQASARPGELPAGEIDMIHIDDVAEANMQALARLHSEEEFFDCFNIGSGVGSSLDQIAKRFSEASGKHFEFAASETLKNSRIADLEYSKAELKWAPKKTLQQICEDTWKFYESIGDLKI